MSLLAGSTCHDLYAEARGELWVSALVPLCEIRRTNSVDLAWLQVPLSAGASHQPHTALTWWKRRGEERQLLAPVTTLGLAKEPAHSPTSSDFFNREFRKHIQTTAQKDWGFAAGLGWRDKEGEKLQKTGMERIEKAQHNGRTPAKHVQGPGFDPQYHLKDSGNPANLVFPLWSILFSS